jgi:hypothetical protein
MNNKSIVLLVTVLALVALSIAAGIKVPLKARQTRLMTKMGANRFPLQGNLTYWGEFFATVGLGTPPQYVQLQVDTGSTDLIVYGAGCGSQCGNPKHFYDESQSSTTNQITCEDDDYYCNQDDCNDDPEGPCDWNDQYGDGSSINGHLDEDVFTIGSLTTQSRVSIGVIDTVDAPNGFEATGVDGIWGFAYQALSGWQGDSVFSHIVGDTGMYDSFSLCLYENNGILELGTDYSKDNRFVWTPIQQDQWYTVYIYDIKLGNNSIGISAWDLNWNGVIVDSGTTLLIVSTQIMTAIQNEITSLCAKTPLVGVCNVPSNQTLFDGLCYPMTAAQVNQFPTLSIKFETAGYLSILPQDYLWQGAGIPGTYCMGIQAMDGGLPVIIGDVFMQRYHVVFDQYEDRVGFGPLSSCPKL